MISIDRQVLADSEPLKKLEPETLKEFCRLALDSITSEKPSKGVYKQAAEKISATPEQVQNAISSLAQVFLACAKKNLSPQNFNLSLHDLSLNEPQREIVTKEYELKVKKVREFLGDLSMKVPNYASFDWRLDIQLGTRALRNNIEPTFLCELDTTTSEGGLNKQVFESDYANLKRIHDELSKALKDSNNKHSNRILRYVK